MTVNPLKTIGDITVTTLVAALVAALGAFVAFQPKFEVASSIRRQTGGSLERAFWILFVLPLWVSVILVALACCLLGAAIFELLCPSEFVASRATHVLAAFTVPQNLVWLLFLAGVFGAVLRFNLISWLLLTISRLTRGFGPRGESVGWLQTYCVCRTWDKSTPLVIRSEEVNRLANLILFKIATNSGPDQSADKPANASNDAVANIALIGCVLEATHYAQRWPVPNWKKFFAALATVHNDTQLFEPSELLKPRSGENLSKTLRDALYDEVKTKQSQTAPDDKYLAAATYLVRCFEELRRNRGSVLKMVPWWSFFAGGKLYWLNRRLRVFPMIDPEGMQPQLLKLLVRWEVLPKTPRPAVFLQPFANAIAWFLLQESVVALSPEQKEVTFWDLADITLIRIACARIFREVEALARAKNSDEASTVHQKYGNTWDLYAAADLALWNWAVTGLQTARQDNWEAAKGWRWKMEGATASRTA
jgi:hypothetical protein